MFVVVSVDKISILAQGPMDFVAILDLTQNLLKFGSDSFYVRKVSIVVE